MDLKKKISGIGYIIILTVIFFPLLFISDEHKDIAHPPLVLEIAGSRTTKELKPWYDNNGKWYFFIPSYAKSEDVKLKTEKKQYLDDKLIKNGMSLTSLECNHPYKLSDGSDVVFLHSENLPAIYLETFSGSMDYLKADKNRQEQGSFTLVDTDGTEIYFHTIPWISGRGNQTWGVEKKGWGFKLPVPTSLLGMAKAEKWALLANVFDPSCGLRNYIAYKMALEAGMEYSSDVRFIDLYLNNEYAGMYLLVERIDQGTERLNIGDLEFENNRVNTKVKFEKIDELYSKAVDENDRIIRTWSDINSPEDISGGYIIERNYGGKLGDKPYHFITKGDEGFVIRYPSIVSKDEADYISQLLQRIEDSLFSDSDEDLYDIIDLNSWVKKYLVDEITKNEGAGSTSSYFYKKQGDDHLYAGPVWDYDKSLGTIFMGRWFDPVGLTYCSLHDAKTLWWKKFYNKEGVSQYVAKRYEDDFRPYVSELIGSEIDRVANEISVGYQLDQIRWGERLYYNLDTYRTPEIVTKGELQDSVSFLKRWLSERMSFLDEIWMSGKEYVCVTINEEGILKYYPIQSGKTVLDNSDFVEKYLSAGANVKFAVNSNQEFDYRQPVTKDIKIYIVEPPKEPTTTNETTDVPIVENTDVPQDETEIVVVEENTLTKIIRVIKNHWRARYVTVTLVIIGFIGVVMLWFDIRRNWTGGANGRK